jgi:hypothetical protein
MSYSSSGSNEFDGYSEDELAKRLLKRLVQAVGRSFYDDTKVPMYL